MTITAEPEHCELTTLRSGTPHSEQPGRSKSSATSVRWCKFNFVGAIGIAVQFAVLFLLKSGLHFHYLVATAIAVEVAILHNFVWHERFTWSDRVTMDRVTSGLETVNRVAATRIHVGRHSLRRLLRFHLANGTVSILGNVALMKVMVSFAHMNYFFANAIAIALCSVGNFLLSDEWVFEGEMN